MSHPDQTPEKPGGLPQRPRRPHFLEPSRSFGADECRYHLAIIEECLRILQLDEFDFRDLDLRWQDSEWILQHLLRQVNSAQFSLGVPITDSRHAATIMGQLRLVDMLRRLSAQLQQRLRRLETAKPEY